MLPSAIRAETRPTPYGSTKRDSPLADCKHVVSVYSFTPLAGVLFTVPSRYSALSVGDGIEPWRVGPPVSHRVSRVPRYSGSSSRRARALSYGVLTLSDRPFQAVRSTLVRTFRGSGRRLPATPTTPPDPSAGRPCSDPRFGLSPVRSPLLGGSHTVDFFSSGY